MSRTPSRTDDPAGADGRPASSWPSRPPAGPPVWAPAPHSTDAHQRSPYPPSAYPNRGWSPPAPPAPPGGAGYPGAGWGAPATPPTRRRRRGTAVTAWLLLVVGLALGALSLPVTRQALDSLGMRVPGVESLDRGLRSRPVPDGWTSVTDAVNPGLVDIETRLANGIGAGTGMVLTADGRVLTNYHVVEGASRIVVTSVTTGDEYDARVIGAEPDEDVAVLQLEGASGLTPIPIGDPGSLQIGDPVAAIGNAGGLGGLPSVAAGSVVGMDQSITATDEDGGSAERLSGMIGIRADVRPGDSGGALATSDGRVVGMTTAASSARRTGQAQTGSGGGYGFAIPIDHALAMADAAVADG